MLMERQTAVALIITASVTAAVFVGGGHQAAAQDAEPIAPLLAEADAEAGQQAFRQCMACHTVEEGGPNRVGPNLWDIVGRPVASKEGFNYSEAMKNLGGEWDYEALNRFLAAPREYVPGTRMIFAGVKDTQARADMIAYLRTLSSDPVPLP